MSHKTFIRRGRRTFGGWMKLFKTKQIKIEPRKLTEKDIVYFICLTDGATGQVNYYSGIDKKYSRDKYLLYLSKKDRDNAAYQLLNNTAEII